MGPPSSVSIDDDLTASESSISLGPSDGESSARVQVEDGAIVEKIGGDDSQGHFVLQLPTEVIKADFRVVLSGDNDSVDSLGHTSSSIESVFDSNLNKVI